MPQSFGAVYYVCSISNSQRFRFRGGSYEADGQNDYSFDDNQQPSTVFSVLAQWTQEQHAHGGQG